MNTSEIKYHVGLSAHLLSNQPGYRQAGIHNYLTETLRHLPAASSEHDIRYSVYSSDSTIEYEPMLKVSSPAWSTASPIARILWEQLALPLKSVDLIHSTAFVSPLLSRRPSVVTVYDLSFIRFPEALPQTRKYYLSVLGRLSAQRARRVITISEHSRDEIANIWNVPVEKIEIAYPGVDPEFRILPIEKVQQFRTSQNLPERFILHVGTLQPRKNLIRLIQAFNKLDNDIHLILVGAKGWYFDRIMSSITELGLQHRIHLLGFIPTEEMVKLYNAAELFAFPSLYEGFGMPVVEALACGTPVVASRSSSIPEAAGRDGTATLFDPTNVDDIAYAMHNSLQQNNNDPKVKEMRTNHTHKFTWMNTAQVHVSAYLRALGERDE
ncbi:MAG: glycosyltransferase family 1 protein [Chloroflexota bacterium]